MFPSLLFQSRSVGGTVGYFKKFSAQLSLVLSNGHNGDISLRKRIYTSSGLSIRDMQTVEGQSLPMKLIVVPERPLYN